MSGLSSAFFLGFCAGMVVLFLLLVVCSESLYDDHVPHKPVDQAAESAPPETK
jgi:hypothetical protein